MSNVIDSPGLKRTGNGCQLAFIAVVILIMLVCVVGAIHAKIHYNKWMNGEIDGIKRVMIETGGFNPRREIVTQEEYERLVKEGIVIGRTLRR